MMSELAAAMLRKQLLKNLESLEEQAKSEGKRLTQKKERKRYLYTNCI